MQYIKNNLEKVRNELSEAATSANRTVEEVKLLAVSKRFPVEAIEIAYSAGQRAFGENKVQELEFKVPALPDDIEWHLIGHLQSNKVAKAVQLAKYIHSVDSEKLLKRIDRLANENNKIIKIFFEVNISGEESKNGMTAQASINLSKEISEYKNIELVGLMTMAPFSATSAELDAVFAKTKSLMLKINEESNLSLSELSMGMSSDYKNAIANGATIVRIGTSIFGKRD